MADFGGKVRDAARRAGRKVGAVGKRFEEGKAEGTLPQDESGRARIVCRRYAERRAVPMNAGTPACYEPENPDCESCLADIRDGVVETW